jgi:hypothetical protein
MICGFGSLFGSFGFRIVKKKMLVINFSIHDNIFYIYVY